MRLTTVLFASLLLTPTFAAAPARAEVGAYLLFDMADGRILAQHEATTPWYPASITKLMTAYVTLGAVRDGEVAMRSPVTISAQARQQPPSRSGFALGTVLTVETALRIILTKSANDISVALAEAIGGTQAGFVARMNRTAERLGMSATRYDNPHGLPNRAQVTTARDVAVLMMALERTFGEHAEVFAMDGVQLGRKALPNHNGLLRRFRGADGMKTGFICASGFNLAATATRDGVRLGAVVLGGLTSRERDERTAELLSKGFATLRDGGSVRLDGFGAADPAHPDARLALAAADSGEAPGLGLVEELANAADAPVVDRRAKVCGAARPLTRYGDGTVATRGEVVAQRRAHDAYEAARAKRRATVARLLAAPRPDPRTRPGLPAPLARSPADATLAGEAWRPTFAFPPPPTNPDRAAPVEVASATASTGGDAVEATLAPEGWIASPRFPAANPLQAAGLRTPVAAPGPARPLTYLEPARPARLVAIALGGADDTRPEPLSGPLLGGGPAPVPPPRPVASLLTPTDPDSIMRYAAEVRGRQP
ncbi:serine hydrolase [Acuticoccus sp.]|uniref:serine hydrolase n=1 Tax=Acuticoccus sp. TaxID=1904378 RepID=UPI003B518B87